MYNVSTVCFICSGISLISVYQISEWQFSGVLIRFRNSEYPWLSGAKMASRFEIFSEDEICAINEAVEQTYQESDELWLVSVHWQVENYFQAEFATES